MSRSSLSGWITGAALSPITGLVSGVRQSRMFHPSGIVCSAEVERLSGIGPGATVAERLVGPALVRWSSAWWKRGEWRDVLGCAIRFSQAPLRAEARQSDQDLLLATIQRPWSMPFSPLTTRHHDFLANHYYSVSPFEVASLGRVEWRLSVAPGSRSNGAQPTAGYAASPPSTETRTERLLRAFQDGSASLLLEWAPYAGALHRAKPEHFSPLVRIGLGKPLEIDQAALRFDPFQAGRGLAPVGFVNAMRRATYSASQTIRPRQGASAR
jgi:hypothetical protein